MIHESNQRSSLYSFRCFECLLNRRLLCFCHLFAVKSFFEGYSVLKSRRTLQDESIYFD